MCIDYRLHGSLVRNVGVSVDGVQDNSNVRLESLVTEVELFGLTTRVFTYISGGSMELGAYGMGMEPVGGKQR